MTKRLCKLNRRDITEHLGEIHSLVTEAKFVCRSCARSSTNQASLCKPAAIPPVSCQTKPAEEKAACGLLAETLPSSSLSSSQNFKPKQNQAEPVTLNVIQSEAVVAPVDKKSLKKAKKSLKKQQKQAKKLAKVVKKQQKLLKKHQLLEKQFSRLNQAMEKVESATFTAEHVH